MTDESDPAATTHDETVDVQDTKRLKAAYALATRAPGETMRAVARRGGVSRATLYRWMGETSFQDLVNRVLAEQVEQWRPAVLQRVIRDALSGSNPDKRLFFQLTGDLSNDGRVQEGNVHVHLHDERILREPPSGRELPESTEREGSDE